MKRAIVHVDLANKSCAITTRRRFYGSWGPDITRSLVGAVIAVDGWRFAPGGEWVMTVDGGTRQVERPGAVRVLIDRIRELLAVRASDRHLDHLGSATPTASDELDAALLALRQHAEDKPMPVLVDTDTAITAIRSAA